MNKNTEFENYIVCYFDVLGTKQKEITTALKDMWLVSHCTNKTYNSTSKIIKRSFSDNFLIASKIQDNQSSFDDIVNNIGYTYSLSLLDLNIFIRGAIVRGGLIFTSDVVLGDALINAYNLESNVAVFPRIVISDDLGVVGSESYADYFIKDEDGVVFLNCLKFIDQKFLKIRYKTLLDCLVSTSNELGRKNRKKEKAKVEWLIHYLASYYKANFNNKI